MAAIPFEEFPAAETQTARTWGTKANLVAKFALFVGAGGLMLGSGCREHHSHPNLAFQVQLFANLATFILGLLLVYVSMVAPSESTATRYGKITMWMILFMSAVTLALGSFFLTFRN